MSKPIHPALIEKNPKLAEVIQSLSARFEGQYDLSKRENAARFVEGMALLGEHIAMNCTGASIMIDAGSSGIVAVSVGSIPRS